MIIETKRLILRPINEKDVPNIQKYFPHWEIVAKMSRNIPWPYPEDGARQFYEGLVVPNMGKDRWFWAINEKQRPDYLIGTIELRKQMIEGDGHRGFWLGLPYHRRGYMTEAASAVNDFGFREWNMPEIVASAAAGNEASYGVKAKQGMRWIKREPCTPVLDGTDEHDVFVITREEWLRSKGLQFEPGLDPASPSPR